ncbi:MAG: indole-3-glycerol phosphate synthase TrpC [Sphaerochaetaceae bacterium]|nr:indole-3-glycerol phosphate synthase TrpC [Sphaerochaetaceae bacterium]
MILDKIAAETKKDLDAVGSCERKKMEQRAFELKRSEKTSFYDALAKPGLSYIAEVKKASPSKGLICEDFHPVEIAREYERIGIDAISVLTEEHFFLGEGEYLQNISSTVNVPTLRKDFIIDAYQVHEAAVLGASAILLICALLDLNQLSSLYKEAISLNMDVLVEAHNEEEVEKALSTDASIIGINNRDLHSFEVDLNTSYRLRAFIPAEKIMVSESGYFTREDIERAVSMGADAVLIGESFMRSMNKDRLLASLKGETE